MSDLAQRLMASAQQLNIEFVSPTFSQSARRFAQKSLFRIGLWPIKSNAEHEIGMGLGLILAALLERYSSVRVYRLLARVSEWPSSYEWSIDESQFDVDDWEVEGLDENVAIWGTFEVRDTRIHFSVFVENDANEDNVIFELDYKTDTLVDMINLLPSIAEKIIIWLDPTTADKAGDRYDIIPDGDALLIKAFLNNIFRWELDYFLALWGQETESPVVLKTLNMLVVLSKQLNCNFGAWMIAQSMSRFMIYDDIHWSGFLIPTVKETIESLLAHPVIGVVLGITLFRLNYSLQAFDLLESALVLYPKHSRIWNTLAALYSEIHQDLAAIDIYQRAIEAKSATSDTYLRYANLMGLLAEHQIEFKSGNQHVSPAGRPFFERYIFANSEDTFINLREAAGAYLQAFELDDTNIDLLGQLVTCLITLQDAAAWKYCQTLIEDDKEGVVTAIVIEQLSDDDMESMIVILRKALVQAPQHVTIRINLARAYIALGENAKAKTELELISKEEIPLQAQSTLSRLRLAADNSDFESRLGEIDDVLHAKAKASSDDIEFLESTIEKEPAFSNGYKLLAECYLSWNESNDALEVLLDCQNNAPFDPDVTSLLAKVLWDAGQPDLAFAYLEKGLERDKRNATLLSLNGRFLFDNGQDEDAKEFLLRAEDIDPSNSELTATRLHIASVLIETGKD